MPLIKKRYILWKLWLHYLGFLQNFCLKSWLNFRPLWPVFYFLNIPDSVFQNFQYFGCFAIFLEYSMENSLFQTSHHLACLRLFLEYSIFEHFIVYGIFHWIFRGIFRGIFHLKITVCFTGAQSLSRSKISPFVLIQFIWVKTYVLAMYRA